MSSADLASLRIAEDRIEWAVTCDHWGWQWRGSEEIARDSARALDRNPDCAPHRVVSRRVITTEWAEADE